LPIPPHAPPVHVRGQYDVAELCEPPRPAARMVVETGAAVHDENTGPGLCGGGITHHDAVEYDVVIAIDDGSGGDRGRIGEALIHAGKVLRQNQA
jgi:hypothetical protein